MGKPLSMSQYRIAMEKFFIQYSYEYGIVQSLKKVILILIYLSVPFNG